MKFLPHISNELTKPFSTLSLKRLEAEMSHWRVPYHLGLILDGNRRYAKKHHIWNIERRDFGHAQGADKLEEILHWCNELDIKIVSVWVFSLDNFKRDQAEVETIFELVKRKTESFLANSEVHEKKIRLRFVGETTMLPPDTQVAMHIAEEATREYDQYLLNVCISYGGRDEILESFRKHLIEQHAQGKDLAQVADELCLDAVTKHLYTADLPDPDLIIRTGGEMRLGGFLLWQCVYTEFSFPSTYWPELSRLEFLKAIRGYSIRERRFGK